MKTKIIFPLFAALTFSIFCYSQVTITGRVLDSVTHEPIPYCNVYFLGSKEGAVTDESGNFNLKSDIGGELLISNIEYTFKKYTLQKNTDLKTVYLSKRAVIELAPIEVKPKKCKVKKFGILKKNWYSPDRYEAGERAGEKRALYIENPCRESETAIIKSLFYYIVDPTDTGYVFRVQVYDATGNALRFSCGPGNALIPENILLRKPKNNGWIEVDISKYHIQVPKEGIFVSIEFLQNSPHNNRYMMTMNEEESILTDWSKNIQPYDSVNLKAMKLTKKQVERTGYNIKEINATTIRIATSTYKNKIKKDIESIGGRWFHLPPGSPFTTIENPCIYAAFEICK